MYYQQTSTREIRKLSLSTPIHRDKQNQMATETSKYESQSQTKNSPKMLDIQKTKTSGATPKMH